MSRVGRLGAQNSSLSPRSPGQESSQEETGLYEGEARHSLKRRPHSPHRPSATFPSGPHVDLVLWEPPRHVQVQGLAVQSTGGLSDVRVYPASSVPTPTPGCKEHFKISKWNVKTLCEAPQQS